MDKAAGEDQGEQEADGTPKADDGKDRAAVELGRRGGLKGGKARAEKLTAEQRRKIAKKAAQSRWSMKGIKNDGQEKGTQREKSKKGKTSTKM